MIASLTPAQQALVRDFVEFVKAKDSPEIVQFLSAVDEFMGDHPDLLQDLAQDNAAPTAPDDSPARRTAFETAQATMHERFERTFRTLSNSAETAQRPTES